MSYHYLIIKGPVHQVDITIVNIFAPHIGMPKCIMQTITELKGEMDSSIIALRDLNTLLSILKRPSNQKINKETDLERHQMNRTDIYRT